MTRALFLLIASCLLACINACGPAASTPATAPNSAAAVPVLMYHEITSAKPPGETVISPERFAAQMQFLQDHGYHTLTIPQLLDFLSGKPTPKRSLLLTFDDGWKSQEPAAKILQQHHFHAVFFIITGAADGNFGPDYLSWPQIETLSRDPLFDVESHSVTHPWNPLDNFLTWSHNSPPGKSIDDVRRQLTASKKSLEDHLHKPIQYWAWPCGWTTTTLTQEAHNAGYRAQFTTEARPNTPGTNPNAIRRYFVNGNWQTPQFARLLTD